MPLVEANKIEGLRNNILGTKIIAASALAALVLATGSVVTAGNVTIKAVSKSTQTPPVPDGIKAILGDDVALWVGQIGVPGVVLVTIVIGGILFSIFSTSSSTTTI